MRWNITIPKRTISLALTAVMAFGCLLNTSSVSLGTNADPNLQTNDLSLGAAQGYNLVCFDSFQDGKTDILGKCFIGGNVSCPLGFTFGSDQISANDYGLILGSTVNSSFSIGGDGNVVHQTLLYNNAVINSQNNGSFTYHGCVEWQKNGNPQSSIENLLKLTGIDLSAPTSNSTLNNHPVTNFQQQMITKSADIANLTGIKIDTANSSGELVFTGTDTQMNVFSVDASKLNQYATIRLDTPSSSTDIINVTNSTAVQSVQIPLVNGSNGTNLEDAYKLSRLLWNMGNAENVSNHGGCSIKGSVLAPQAIFTATGGNNFEGELIVDAFKTKNSDNNINFEGHNYPFIPPITLTKTAKLVNWDDRTYDINLTASKAEDTRTVANFSANLYRYNTQQISYQSLNNVRVINASTIANSGDTNTKNLYFGHYNHGLDQNQNYPKSGDWNQFFHNCYDSSTRIEGLVYPGIVQNELINNQLQFSPGFGQSNLFSDTVNQVSGQNDKTNVYKDVAFPFHKDQYGNYSFDSGVNTSDGKNEVDTGDNATFNAASNSITVTKGSYGFFPFDNPSSPTNHSYSFGMSMGIQFKIPSERKVNSADGKTAMKFDFSGDDDVWVFVDGHLALDIGGIHRPRTGSINFEDGTAIVDYTAKLDDDGNVKTVTTYNQTYEKYDKDLTKHLYTTYPGSNLGIDPTEDKYHTLQVFYLERGDGDSNFKMSFNLYDAKELETTADVKDYIDPRFEVVGSDGNPLNNGDHVGNDGKNDGILTKSGNSAYVTWPNQDISAKQKWNRTFRVKAKREFIGGNNIPTNEPTSGIYKSNGDFIQAFPQPTVNVQPKFYIGNDSTTIFRGESVPPSQLLQPYTLKADGTKKVFEPGMYIPPKDITGNFTYVWKDEKDSIIHDSTAKCTPGTHPDNDTHYTLTATFVPDAATAASNANSTTSTGGITTTHTAINTPNENTGAAGIYTVNVVTGELDISKTITDLYPAPTEVEAQQSFVFKIERFNSYEEATATTAKATAAETFYEVITPKTLKTDVNNNSRYQDTKMIKGLKQGYYKITEEATNIPGSDAWRYKEVTDENDTKATKDNDNWNGTNFDHIVYIGRKLSEISPINKQYFGAQEKIVYDPITKISITIAANPAKIDFTNSLLKKQWLGDTTVVVNNISNKNP